MTIQTTVLNPKYIYVQAIAPTDKTIGKLWYNTIAKNIYSSDGTNYNVLSTNLTPLELEQSEQNMNILINSAGASTTLNDYDNMFLDIFSDADGTSNTIDTGNTTATFITNKYKNVEFGSPTTESNGLTFSAGSVLSYTLGFQIIANVDCQIISIGANANSTATTGYIYASNGTTLLGSALFSSGVATFTNPIPLTSGLNYFIVSDSAGADYTYSAETTSSFPISNTNINWTAGENNSLYGDPLETAVNGYNIDNIVTKIYVPDNLTAQTNAITVTTAQTHHQLYCHNTTVGTGTITYDISFDNGTTWDTDQALNTKNTRASTTGTEMILKLNLNGVGAGNTAEAKDYAVMLYY